MSAKDYGGMLERFNATDVTAATSPAEAADAAEARYRTFIEIVGQMDADERARAMAYLASIP